MSMFLAAAAGEAALTGVIVGRIITFISTTGINLFFDFLKRSRERARVAALSAGVFSAVREHLEESRVVTEVRNVMAVASAGKLASVNLIFPIRGSFLGTLNSVEPTLSLLPGDLCRRTARQIVLLRGIVEDFTTLKDNVRFPAEQAAFCQALITKIESCSSALPDLIQDLDNEARLAE
jgi:hypothetical protein